MRRESLGGQFWAELVGTMILILLGDGVVANTVFAPRLGEPGYNWNTITLGWGFAVVFAVYIAGGITGAHINPAVTVAAMVRRTISVTTGLVYIVGQVIGAFIGAALVHLLYFSSFQDLGYRNVFYTGPATAYANAVFNQYYAEIIGTFMLLLGVYAIVDNVRNVGPGANLWPFMVGMLVLSIGLSLGGPTGYAINPARDFGPRLYASLFAGDAEAFASAYWLVPIIGPLIGGTLGALFYDFLMKPFLPLPQEPEPAPRGADVTHIPFPESER
ncbi:MAG: aquaporin [Herpetosiphonaceae bacterium]|nr:MAG: aquaporin [Herpetosiphonaceae bacterium]